ncbi:MAG TPA: hypothetical protein PLS29_01235 [Acidimicrobiales bacterium]|nr:hypothetical protein [Acidimicrobiales bacterium]
MRAAPPHPPEARGRVERRPLDLINSPGAARFAHAARVARAASEVPHAPVDGAQRTRER